MESENVLGLENKVLEFLIYRIALSGFLVCGMIEVGGFERSAYGDIEEGFIGAIMSKFFIAVF